MLEAPSITLDNASVTANGGGGGSGSIGSRGEYGNMALNPALGGTGEEGTAGGAGGARNGLPQSGEGPIDGAGGGGGGVGIIRFNVPADSLNVNASIISPQETRGDLTVQ